MRARGHRHLITIEIETLDRQGTRAAQDRVLRWLETFGHTSPGHGFEFVSVGRFCYTPIRSRVHPKSDTSLTTLEPTQ